MSKAPVRFVWALVVLVFALGVWKLLLNGTGATSDRQKLMEKSK